MKELPPLAGWPTVINIVHNPKAPPKKRRHHPKKKTRIKK